MQVDSCIRFVQEGTILEEIEDNRHQGKTDEEIRAIFDSSLQNPKRVTIITRYGNSRSYQTDDLIFDQSPATHTFTNKDGVEKGMREYFHETYNLELDPN